MKDVVVKVENLSKRYRIGLKEDTKDTLFGALGSVLKSPFRNLKRLQKLTHFNNGQQNSDDIIWALKDVSFEVKRGEIIGIIGKNGAGKSTLLKILAQITHPTSGRVELNGRIASLLEVGTGFHPELTGRENIYLNGTILGMTKKEIDRKLDQIIDFSGVEIFLDTPVKRYSSGMRVRLAFAVAAHLEPEILIIDEVLAVGDAEFQKKCLGKMKDVAQQGRTVVFVSHNMAAMQTLCNNGVLLNDGEIKFSGNIEDTIIAYKENSQIIFNDIEISKGIFDLKNHPNKQLKNLGVLKALTYCDNKLANTFYPGCSFKFEVEIRNKEDDNNTLFGFIIKTNDNEPIIGINNRHTGDIFTIKKGEIKTLSINLPDFPVYRNGIYWVDFFLGNRNTNYEIIENAFSFEIECFDIYKTANILDPKLNLILNKHATLKLLEK